MLFSARGKGFGLKIFVRIMRAKGLNGIVDGSHGPKQGRNRVGSGQERARKVRFEMAKWELVGSPRILKTRKGYVGSSDLGVVKPF